MLVRLTMIRSGATPATRKGAFALDEPLEPRAHELAAAVGARLRRADRVLTSPTPRARQTAEAMSLQASVEPLLAEQDHGRWAGKSLEAVHADDPQGIAAWLADPDAAPHGGESLADVSRRASTFMDRLMAERGHTIVVTHASVIRAAIVHVLGAPLAACRRIDIEPLGVTEFSSDGRRWMLRITRSEKAD
ncbi:histidine phosphatase family protein [Mesorhizobium sp. PAMC28654]|uniref:histidine phosphatase family protein n=1 Tax=Mesorhizobium sp. PAMC28654 TaxID=2880934 RepID=UPI001D0A208E|nr:histidine phosphatase family protein [Mesorhizobium sp. PAMC28654]UDL89214.1 histidine phosphatase family protein [Mesorhizobium sp. PAMC28654]